MKRMSDLIYRNQAIDAVSRGCKELRGIFADCEKNLNELPSAEPEIVRCEDCKYYDPIGVCIEMSSAVCEDSFCCWAERTDEQSDRQAEINATEKRIKDCNPNFDYHHCSVRQNYNGKGLPSEFCRYCGACMEVDNE